MYHSDRIFGIQQVSDVKSLANKLYDDVWNECVGFQIGEYLFLNDSFSTEGVQEYAVFGSPMVNSSKSNQLLWGG